MAVVERDLVARLHVFEPDVHVAAPSCGDDHVVTTPEADELTIRRGAAGDGEPRTHRLAGRQAVDHHADGHLGSRARDAGRREVLVRIHGVDGRARDDLRRGQHPLDRVRRLNARGAEALARPPVTGFGPEVVEVAGVEVDQAGHHAVQRDRDRVDLVLGAVGNPTRYAVGKRVTLFGVEAREGVAAPARRGGVDHDCSSESPSTRAVLATAAHKTCCATCGRM